MYDDVIVADRFRYPLTISWNRVWIGLSRLLHAHIAYRIHTAKSSPHFAKFPIVCMITYGSTQ